MLNGKSKDFSDKHWTEVEVRVYEKVSILLSPFSCSSKSYRKSLFNPLPSSSSLHPSEKNVYAHHTSLLRSCVLRLDLAFNLKVGPSYHHPFHLFPLFSLIDFPQLLSTTYFPPTMTPPSRIDYFSSAGPPYHHPIPLSGWYLSSLISIISLHFDLTTSKL